MLEHLRRLFDHMYWADHRALESLRNAGLPHPKALEIYAHILGAEHTWLTRLRGAPAAHAVWPKLTLAECGPLASENQQAFSEYLAQLDEDALAREVHYRNSAGAEFDSRIDDILLHVVLHGTYHRGQVAFVVRNEGDVPNATDYIAFVRGIPAATRR
jgi:uncharacterized damage-inducible protein DinB